MSFWLILLPWMFVSSYTTIYFFVKNFFSNVYISENSLFECYLFFDWETDNPFNTNTTWGMEGGYPKFVQVHAEVRELKNWSWDTYVVLWNIFCALVQLSTLEHRYQQGNIVVFSIINTIILSYTIIRI